MGQFVCWIQRRHKWRDHAIEAGPSGPITWDCVRCGYRLEAPR